MKCFSIYSNQIKKRFDPKFLITSLLLQENKSDKITYKKLSEFLLAPPQYGANEAAVDWSESTVYRYIRITDIDEFGNLKNNDIKTASYIDIRYELEENDILFARSGATAGKCLIYKKEYGKAIFAGYLIRFKINSQKLNPKFLFYYTQTKYYKDWVESIQRPAGQPNINSKEFCSLEIPVFSENNEENLKIQENIISIMDQAYCLKSQYEDEANDLLVALDNIILKRLDIERPNVVDSKTYIINSNDIRNGRMDALGYQPTPRAILKSIHNSKYSNTIVSLKNLIIENFSGEWGKDYQKEIPDEFSLCKVLRNKNFNNIYNIDFDEVAYRIIPNTKKNKILLKKGDILIEKSGGSPQQAVGRVAYIKKNEGNLTFSNFLQCIRIDQSICNPEFLFIYLRIIYRLNYMKYIQSQTTGIINLLMDDFFNIPVILLKDIREQEQLVINYNNVLNQAKKLQNDAEYGFKQAKIKIEKMILGEE